MLGKYHECQWKNTFNVKLLFQTKKKKKKTNLRKLLKRRIKANLGAT